MKNKPQPSFDDFLKELRRLCETFSENRRYFKAESFDESSLRIDYLDPLWTALGWDLHNIENRPQALREVQAEPRVHVEGRKKRADYVFRTDGLERFVCEAKRPQDDLQDRQAYQVQRYAYNLRVRVAILSNFERLKIFILGGQPDPASPWDAWKDWHFAEFEGHAKEIWDLISRDNVAGNSLEAAIAALPKKVAPKAGRQGWLIAHERIKTVDAAFLDYIEGRRLQLANDLMESNPGRKWTEFELNEAVQRILNRLLLIRICEDRDIDTGRLLEYQVLDWESSASKRPFYVQLVNHFHSLDRRFNGTLFNTGDFSENLKVSDDFLIRFRWVSTSLRYPQ